MGKFIALTRKEIAGILLTPPILFATAFFVLLDSFAFYMTTAVSSSALAMFDDIALFMVFTSIILYPLISMQSFSEENASGTLETLLTAPIGSGSAVLAKYAGGMAFVLLYLVHGAAYTVLLSYGGNLDWNSALTGFAALTAVGSLAMSLGVFISAMTLTPAAAAAGTGGILIFLTIAGDIDPYSGTAADILHTMSFFPHAKRWIAGEIDTRGFIYFVSATVLFLFYAWLAVGARGTERRSSSAKVRRRMTVTYILVSSGFVLLLTQVAVLHIRGFWESGTPLGPGLGRVPRIWLTPLFLSAASFVWSVLTFRAARRAERERRGRTAKYATISESQVMGAPRYYYEENIRARRRVALAAVSALIIVLNINWLSQYPFRTFTGGRLAFLAVLQDRSWDVTEDKRNSLSATTRRVLDGLQGRVQIYSFLTEHASVQGVPVTEEVRRLLERYNDYSALVTPTFADHEKEQAMAGELARELNIPVDKLENFLALDYQGRRITVPAAALVTQPDWQSQLAGSEHWVFSGESQLTQAIMRLVDPRIPNVLFTYGHLEHSLAPGTYPDRSISRLTRAMNGANMRVRQVQIGQGRPVPADCDILVIASPRIPFREDEAEEVGRYLERGGRLLVFAPAPGQEFDSEHDPLNDLLFSLGGGYRNDIIGDTINNDNGQTVAPKARLRGSSAGSPPDIVFPFSRSIRDNPLAYENGWTSERMYETYPTAAAEDGSSLRPGPFTLISRSAKSADPREARVVLIASGRMAADSDIIRGSNEAVVMGMTQWLAGREESRDIEPRRWTDRRLTLTGPQLRTILWLGVVALPLAWLLAGISVWWLRRD